MLQRVYDIAAYYTSDSFIESRTDLSWLSLLSQQTAR